MKLFYVIGGGWGHLQRVRLFIQYANLAAFRILTNNPVALQLFDSSVVILLKEEQPELLCHAVQKQISDTGYDELFIDTFPAGMFGELNQCTIPKQNYLARRLRWDQYKVHCGEPKSFFTTYTFEELEAQHLAYIRASSRHIMGVNLQHPTPGTLKLPKEISPDRAVWLIVHAFIQEETEMLLQYAKDTAQREKRKPVFVVITDQLLNSSDDVLVYAHTPAADWFPLAERIFAGGGFNTVNELKPFASRTMLIPFPRRYDDQAWRVAQFRKS